MAATEEKKNKKNLTEPKVEEAGGMRGWLLKKAKTFVWDAASNTLTLPKGVLLTKEEKKALEEIFGEIRDEAEIVDKHRRLQSEAMQQAGVKLKDNVIKGYALLVKGVARDVNGRAAQRIHDNLQGMVMINKRFLTSVWRAISGTMMDDKPKQKAVKLTKDRGGR